MKGKLILKSLLITCVLILSSVIIISAVFACTGYLSATEKIDANILVVEGWLPDDGLKEAYNEFLTHKYDYIVTTGVSAEFDHCYMYSGGYLIFYPKEKLPQNSNSCKHLIEVSAFSALGGENAACFNLFVNNSIIAKFTTSVREKRYPAYWEGALSDIDSITIQFTNDLVGDFGDRNLYVKNITIDKKTVIPSLNYSEYDRDNLDGKNRVKNDFTSYASLGGNELIRMGIDPHLLIAISGEKTQINRTLASAIAVKNWLDTTHIKVTGMNIVSYGMHSRRTWLIYSKVLKTEVKTGIVSLPDKVNQTKAEKAQRTIRETLGIIYYWFVLQIH